MDESKAGSEQAPPGEEGTPEHREWLAAAYDTDVHEHWLRLFEDLALGTLVPPERGMALEIGCATGRGTERFLGLLPPKVRLVAQEDRLFLLDRARGRLADQVGGRLFFNSDALPKLRYDDDVFSLVFSNLSWWERPDRDGLLAEVFRVLDDEGRLVLTAPLAGSFRQLFDLAHEVLVKLDLVAALGPALGAAERAFSEPEAWAESVKAAGLDDVRVEQAVVHRSFPSSHGLFASTVAQARWLGMWKRFFGEETERLLWHVRQAIDTYWVETPFPLTIVAGCLTARKVPAVHVSLVPEAFVRTTLNDDDVPTVPPSAAPEGPLGARPTLVDFPRPAGSPFASGDEIADALLESPLARPSRAPEPIRLDGEPPIADSEPIEIEIEPVEVEPPASPPEWDRMAGLRDETIAIGEDEILPDDLDGDFAEPVSESDLHVPSASPPPVDPGDPGDDVIEPLDLGEPQIEPVAPVDLRRPEPAPQGAADDVPEWDRDWEDDD